MGTKSLATFLSQTISGFVIYIGDSNRYEKNKININMLLFKRKKKNQYEDFGLVNLMTIAGDWHFSINLKII